MLLDHLSVTQIDASFLSVNPKVGGQKTSPMTGTLA